MAILQAQAKLYQGFRCYVVDKTISAFLSSSFTMGNRNIPSPLLDGNGNYTVYPNAKASKIIRTIADLFVSPTVGLSNQKLKTFGGGNNVITPGTPRVIDNTNNWKFVSELKCKFPTYFRLDIEALGLPEGTDCVIQMEEGFVIEGDYPGSFKSPNPYNPQFTTFRTPKRFYNVKLPTSIATLSSVTGFRRYANAGLNTVSTMVPRITYNPGRFASLEMSYFNKVTTARKTVRPGSTMASLFTLTPPAYFRTRLYDSTFVTSPFTLNQPSNLARIRYTSSLIYNYLFLTSSPYKYHGIIKNLDGFVMLAANVTRIEMRYDYTAYTYMASNVGHLRKAEANLTSQSILQCDVLHKEGIVQQSSVVSTLYCSGDKPLRLVTNPSVTSVSLRLGSGTTNIKVEWGDGSIETYTTPNTTITHTYSTAGEYNVRLTGQLDSLGEGTTPAYSSTFRGIANLGELGLKYVSGLGRYGDIIPDVFPSSLEAIPYCFYNRTSGLGGFGGPYSMPAYTTYSGTYQTKVRNWNMSNIKDISFCFYNIRNAVMTSVMTQWNVSNVTNMESCFEKSGMPTGQFDNLSQWNTGNVTNMKNMWKDGTNYFTIQYITGWNTSSVTTLEGCFNGQYNGLYNINFSDWDTSNVTNFSYCFANIQDGVDTNVCNGWDVSAATNMDYMFYATTATYGAFGATRSFNLKDWCVPQFTTEPTNFKTGSGRIPPPWGHCGGLREVIPLVATGTVNRESTIKKFGSYSIQSGASYLRPQAYLQYYTRTGFVGTSKFGVEGWFYLTANNPSSYISLFEDTSGLRVYVSSTGELRMTYRDSTGASFTHNTGQTVSINTWHHICLDFNSPSFRFFFNGVGQTITITTGIYQYQLQDIIIGSNNAGSFFYIDDFRVSNAARHIANFTPPTTPHTNGPGPLDVDPFIILLLNAEVNTLDDPSS
jgi:surface protein